MDSLSQMVLGAATAEAVAGKKLGNKAILWGAIGGTIPDLDIFFKFSDPLEQLMFHRGPSHSLLFAFMLAPILGWLLHKLYKNSEASWRDWTLLFLVSLGTHPILDCFTSWGTQLLWPFSDARIAWNTIFVVDPLYTIPFVLFTVTAMFFKRTNPTRAKINMAGIVVSCLYLSLTVFNKYRVDNVIESSLKDQGISYNNYMSNPTPMNNLLWFSVVNGEDRQYLGYYSLLDKEQKMTFVPFEKNAVYPDNLVNNDRLKTVNFITKDFNQVEVRGDSVFVHDLRFAVMNGMDFMLDPTIKPEFIFTYTIDNSDPENPVFNVIEPPRDPEELDKMGKILGQIFERMKGE